MEVKATAKYIRISPRKVRLVTDTLRGKKVEDALAVLDYLPSPAAKVVRKVVRSAASNAENNFQMSPADLVITAAFADEGPVLKRFRPRSHGRVHPILKRSSHITVAVAEKEA